MGVLRRRFAELQVYNENDGNPGLIAPQGVSVCLTAVVVRDMNDRSPLEAIANDAERSFRSAPHPDG
jgi:hypothetical protein